ncbi:MAG: hypothetical protein Q9186_002006 [Xanthomendoza sp. 1 TL-2023]
MSSPQQGTPFSPPPDGNNNNGTSILIITWLFTIISTIIVILKVYTRLRIIRQFGADDILTILALLFLLAFAPLITVSVAQGLGKHIFYLSPASRIKSIKLAILSNPLVFLASSWPNISVAISLNRILVPPPWQVWILYGIPILQYAIHKVLNWAIIEAAFIISAACIPSLRPFIRTLIIIPKGYYHSHSRRHRPPPLVPRESGSGNTSAMVSPSYVNGNENEGGEERDVEKDGVGTAGGGVEAITGERGGGEEAETRAGV